MVDGPVFKWQKWSCFQLALTPLLRVSGATESGARVEDPGYDRNGHACSVGDIADRRLLLHVCSSFCHCPSPKRGVSRLSVPHRLMGHSSQFNDSYSEFRAVVGHGLEGMRYVFESDTSFYQGLGFERPGVHEV